MTDECGFSRRCGRDDLPLLAVLPLAAAALGGWRRESRTGRGRAEMTCVALSITPSAFAFLASK